MPEPPQTHHFWGQREQLKGFGSHVGNLPCTTLSTHTQGQTHTHTILSSKPIIIPILPTAWESSGPHNILSCGWRSTYILSALCHSLPKTMLFWWRMGGVFFYELPATVHQTAKKKWVGTVATVSNLKESLMQGAFLGQLLGHRCIRSEDVNYWCSIGLNI